MGKLRIGGADGPEVKVPTPAEMPLLGGMPPAWRETLTSAIAAMDGVPLGGAVLAHSGPEGALRWLQTVLPDAVRVGEAVGDNGLDLADVPPQLALAIDGRDNTCLFGQYRHALRTTGRRLVTPAEGSVEPFCYLASWDAAGALRWLSSVKDGEGDFIGLEATGDRVVGFTYLKAYLFDADDGRLIAATGLPRVGPGGGASRPRWRRAVIAGDRIVFGGEFNGEGELLGQRIEAPQGAVVIIDMPLPPAMGPGER